MVLLTPAPLPGASKGCTGASWVGEIRVRFPREGLPPSVDTNKSGSRVRDQRNVSH